MLIEVGRPVPKEVLADLVDVTLDDLDEVLATLAEAAEPAGLQLRRVHRAAALVPDTGKVGPDRIREAWRQHLGRTGLDRAQASILGKVQRGELGDTLGNDTRTRAAALVNAGILQRTTSGGSGGFSLSDAARFSLVL